MYAWLTHYFASWLRKNCYQSNLNAKSALNCWYSRKSVCQINRLFITGRNAKPISIDPTFNLGQFLLALMTYRNTLLTNKPMNNTTASATLQENQNYIHKTIWVCKQGWTWYSADKGLRNGWWTSTVWSINSIFQMAQHMRRCHHFENNVISHSGVAANGEKRKIIADIRSLLTSPVNKFDDKIEAINTQRAKLGQYLEKQKYRVLKNLHADNNEKEL